MGSFEVQARSRLGWQIVGIFDSYDRASECALQLDRDRVYDDLRITREIEDPQTGRFRATTVYKCGQKIRDEIAREEEEREKEEAVAKRERRLKREILPRWMRRSDRGAARRDFHGNPLQIALWSAFLFCTAMAAIYIFEFVLVAR